MQGYGTGISKIRFGSADDADGIANPVVLNGTSFVGFNLEPQVIGSTWQWTADANAQRNGASLIYGETTGALRFIAIPSRTPITAQVLTSQNLISNYNAMTLYPGGRLQIGRQQPDMTIHGDYKLSVSGKIVSQSLYITRPITWSDFVFAPSYRLRPLSEVAAYIGQNRRLPDVPSAEQVLREGYDVNQMNARLLQKVEELTLYVLQLDKKIAALEAQKASPEVKR